MKKIIRDVLILTLIAFICSTLIYLAYEMIGGIS